MEFDIGTLIYILVTIIAIVAGVAGKKKNPAGNSAPSGEGSSKGFFDKLEEQLGGFVDEARDTVGSVTDEFKSAVSGNEPAMQEEAAREDVVSQEYDYSQEQDYSSEVYQSEYNAFEGIYDPGQQESIEQVTSEAIRSTNEGDMMQVLEVDEPEYADYFEVVKEFDLGTAVVYSAIINRKEY